MFRYLTTSLYIFKLQITLLFIDRMEGPNREIIRPSLRDQSKIISPRFYDDYQIFRILSMNSPGIPREIIAHKFYQKHFPSSITFQSFLRILRQFWSTCVFSFV